MSRSHAAGARGGVDFADLWIDLAGCSSPIGAGAAPSAGSRWSRRAPSGGRHQGAMPLRSEKVAVGPSGPTVASPTMAPVPSSTVWVPWWAFKSVEVGPGSAALIRQRGYALAHWIVSMLSAALDADRPACSAPHKGPRDRWQGRVSPTRWTR